MSWHFLERWIEKANQHSTLIGKFWITFLIVCRMVIVASVGDRVYNDEQSEFKCNTLQPGCTNVCFNSFSPISHLRFWSFQILFVATPSVMFVVYSAHKSKMKKAASKNKRVSHDDEDDGSEKQFSGAKRGRMNNLTYTTANSKSPNNYHDLRNRTSHESRDSKRRKAQRNSRCKKYDINLHENKLYEDSYQESVKENQDDSYCKRLTGDPPFPISTLIKLPKLEHRSKHHGDGRRHKNTYPSNDERRSSTNTSGFGTIEHRGKQGSTKNANYYNNSNNNNNTNNTDPASVFVWREPTNTTIQGRVGSPKPQTALKPDREAPENNQALNDMVVWFPTAPEDDNVNLARLSSEVTFANDKTHRQSETQLKACQMDSANDFTVRAMPTAPPEYPGIEADLSNKPWNSPSKMSANPAAITDNAKLIGKTDPNCYDDQLKIVKQKVSISNVKSPLPSFAQHFRWYVASVFLRLCMELGFVFLQFMLFGLSVPELYKCNRWPCPNQVDCFISRPMEKTIFLWFMFLYSCICVVLNFAEFVYLIYASITKYSRKRLASSMLATASDQVKRPKGCRNERGWLQLKDGTWIVGGDLHPEEMDMENQQFGYQSGNSLPSRFQYDVYGNRLRAVKSGCKRKQASGDTTFHGGQFLSGRENFNRDYLAFVLDSEEEREELEIELDRQEQADLNDFQDIGANDPNIDANGDDGGAGDAGI